MTNINHEDMNQQAIVITPNVINTLRALPMEDRLNIASALAGEMLLGVGVATDLDPEQGLVYAILRNYVEQASARYNSRRV